MSNLYHSPATHLALGLFTLTSRMQEQPFIKPAFGKYDTFIVVGFKYLLPSQRCLPSHTFLKRGQVEHVSKRFFAVSVIFKQ